MKSGLFVLMPSSVLMPVMFLLQSGVWAWLIGHRCMGALQPLKNPPLCPPGGGSRATPT